MILIYPIYVKDPVNYEIVRKAIPPKSNKYSIFFVVNALNDEYCDLLELADGITFNDYNIVSRAWNEGINQAINSYDKFCIVNQDLRVTPDAIEQIDKALNHHDFVCHNSGNNSFSCFGISKKCFLDVGNFDEYFKPAYFEDNDYHYRLKLKGYNVNYLDLHLQHVGSSVIKHDAEARNRNNLTFAANEKYYVKKWGGRPGKEIFKTPFNE